MRAFSRACHREGKKIGFVPTMVTGNVLSNSVLNRVVVVKGFLHEGHLSLVTIAKKHSDVVVASNYVNPTQFAAHEDFGVYPMEKDKDREKLIAVGCDVVFEPNSLYASHKVSDAAVVVGANDSRNTYQTFVSVVRLEKPLCGITRPHFFRGVATVVAKLFNTVEPDVAVFGMKDYQQFQVIKTMTREMNYDIEIIGGPIQREPDGLAMSSRNALLHEEARPKCGVLYRSLQWAEETLQSADSSSLTPETIIKEIEHRIEEHEGKVDYVKVVDTDTLEDVTEFADREWVVVAVAAFFANKAREPCVRLIDNVQVHLGQKSRAA